MTIRLNIVTTIFYDTDAQVIAYLYNDMDATHHSARLDLATSVHTAGLEDLTNQRVNDLLAMLRTMNPLVGFHVESRTTDYRECAA